VFAVRDGRAEKTAVETGRAYGERIEIVKGVSPGDNVAISPLDRITGGARVKTPFEER
jgi:multidrug efflux pump subunit AcrA (membrane-fusion protein)